MNNVSICAAAAMAEMKGADAEEEKQPSQVANGTPTGPPQTEGTLMNNGTRDTPHSDIQKLQQQLQDIKEQVRL